MCKVLRSFLSETTLRNKFLFSVVAGLVLRLLFMPVAFHRDLLWINGFVSVLAGQGVFDIYGYIKSQYPEMAKQGINYYPPLSYFLLGGFHLLFKWLAPGLGGWLASALGILITGHEAGYRQLLGIPFSRLGFYIGLMKFPYAVFDILCLVLLIGMVKPIKDDQYRAFRFWMINPVVIFASYIFGQFDILVAFFLLSALFFISKERPYLGFFTLGAAVLIKTMPLVLILPLSLIIGKNAKQTAWLLLCAFIPIIALMVPLYLSSGSYVLSSLFPKFLASPGANRLDTLEFLIGKIVFVAGYLYLLFRIVRTKAKSRDIPFDGWRYMLSIVLLSYFIIYTPVHYFQWAVPLIIVGLVNRNIPVSVYALQVICLFVYALNSRPLSAQLFLPLNPEVLYNARSIPEFMNQFMHWGIVMRAARFVFHCCSLYIIWKLIFKPEVTVHA